MPTEEGMEKRNVIAPDRTPTMDKQSSMDDMEKDAVAVFAGVPEPTCCADNGCKTCEAAHRGRV